MSETSAILAQLAEQRGIDFRDYRPEAIARGLELRLLATALDAEGYRRRLSEVPEEIDRLIAAMVVPVSSFFRDPAVFAALEHTVLPALFGPLAPLRDTMRMWIAGAATGEEAWSYAIVASSACDRVFGPRFQILASDLDPASLELARAARYPIESLEHVPEAHRDRWFQQQPGWALVKPELRDLVELAAHDLTGRSLAPKAAVVPMFHLVSLRNVLIYFDRRLQTKVLEKLRSVIEPGGALVLGPMESLPNEIARDFEVFPGTDALHRIYRRLGGEE